MTKTSHLSERERAAIALANRVLDLLDVEHRPMGHAPEPSPHHEGRKRPQLFRVA